MTRFETGALTLNDVIIAGSRHHPSRSAEHLPAAHRAPPRLRARGLALPLIRSAAAALLLSGCSTASLPTLPDITGALTPYPVVGPPTDIYARIARGAHACWLSPSGPLKANYVYHARAEPPSKGGTATIVIHERDPNSTNPRGLRAYRILIAPDEEASTVTVENLSLPVPLAQALERDVHRWAAGAVGCADTDGGWGTSSTPGADDPPSEPKKPEKKGRSA